MKAMPQMLAMKPISFGLLPAVPFLALGALLEAKESAPAKLRAIWKSDEGVLEVWDNSDTISLINHLNDKGEVIGVREVRDDKLPAWNQQPFFSDGKVTKRIPLVEGYTNIEAMGLSNNSLVIGYASRSIGHPEGSFTAFAWDAHAEEMTNLGALESDNGSVAQSISADGTRIVGFSTGAMPPRVRPCLWSRDKQSGEWSSEALPTAHPYNPILNSAAAAISPDGKRIAACATDELFPNGLIDNALFGWREGDSDWERTLIHDDAFRLNGINNQGTLVGEPRMGGQKLPATISWDGELKKIELLIGDVSGEARAINNDGTVVGISDDPPGPEGGPRAFVWSKGKTEMATINQKSLFSAAHAINDAGQIAGLIDVLVKDGKIVALDPSNVDYDDVESGKTLAFRWTPSKAK